MASPVRFAKVRKQLEAVGYRLVRVSGSHHIFERPGSAIVSIPVHGQKVKPNYAKQVEKIIAADEEGRGDDEAGEGEGDRSEEQ